MHQSAITLTLTIGVLVAKAAALAADQKPDVKETNRPDVQDGLKKGWDKVVFGKELDHGEYLKILGALAASVATENPTPLVGYLKDFVDDSVKTLQAGLNRDLVLLALKNPDKVFTSGGLEFSGGFATYNHKKAVGIEVPYKVEVQGTNITVRKRMEWAVTDLPNTFQPYIRIGVKK